MNRYPMVLRTLRSRTLRTLAVALALGGAACSPAYGAVEFEAVSTPPVSVTIRGSFIEMPAGIAAVVRVSLVSDNANEYDGSYKVDLFSRDGDVLTVHRRESRREFVLVGVNPGMTCLEVEIDGRAEDCIDVKIGEPGGA